MKSQVHNQLQNKNTNPSPSTSTDHLEECFSLFVRQTRFPITNGQHMAGLNNEKVTSQLSKYALATRR